MYVHVRVDVFVRRRMLVEVRVLVRMGMCVDGAVGMLMRMFVMRRVMVVMVLAAVLVRVRMYRTVGVLMDVHMGMRVLVAVFVRMPVGVVVVAVRRAVGMDVPMRIAGVLGRHRVAFDPGLAGTATTSRTHRLLLLAAVFRDR